MFILCVSVAFAISHGLVLSPTHISSSPTESLFVYSNGLAGPIPTEIGELQLTEFQAFNNVLTGEIPEELYNNQGLTLLRLDVNAFTGTISPQIGDLVDLTDLWLNNNTLAGPLPATLARLSGLGKQVAFLSFR